MKKSFLFSTLTIIALAITACGGRTTTFRTAPTLAPQTDSSGMTTEYANAIPIESQLLVGTFKLEGTKQAVNAKQAADLVAYWQLLKELTTSGSAAQEEIDATVAAIEFAMTPEQIKTIASMQITRQDLFTIVRQQGGGFGTGTQRNQTQGQGTNNQRNFTFGGGGGGFGGPGGPGGDFAAGGGFANRSSGGQGTGTNRSSNNGQSANGNSFFTSTRAVPSALLDAVINLLKDKSKS